MQRELLDEASESEMEFISSVKPKSTKKNTKSKERDLPLPGNGILSKKKDLKHVQKRFDKKRKNEEISTSEDEEENGAETTSESSSDEEKYQSKLGLNAKKKKIEFALGESKHRIPELGPKRLLDGQYDTSGLFVNRIPLREDGIPHNAKNKTEEDIQTNETGNRYNSRWMQEYRSRQQKIEEDPDYKFLVLLAGKVNTSLESLVQEEDKNAMLRNQRNEQLVRSQITVDRNSIDKVWQYTKEELDMLESDLIREINAKVKVFPFDNQNANTQTILYDLFKKEIEKFENVVKKFTQLSLKLFVYISIIGIDQDLENTETSFQDINDMIKKIPEKLEEPNVDKFLSFFYEEDVGGNINMEDRFYFAIDLLFSDNDKFEPQKRQEDLIKPTNDDKKKILKTLETQLAPTKKKLYNFVAEPITNESSKLIRSVLRTYAKESKILKDKKGENNSVSTVLWLSLQSQKEFPINQFFWRKLEYLEKSSVESHTFFCVKQIIKNNQVITENVRTEVIKAKDIVDFDAEERLTYHPISYAARSLLKMQEERIELLKKTIDEKKKAISDLAERAKNIELGIIDVKRQPELPYEHRLKWLDNPINSGVLRPHPIVISGISSAYSSLIERVPWVTKTRSGTPIDVQIFQHDTYMRDMFASLVATEMALVANAYPKKYLQLGLRQFSKEDRIKTLKTIRDGFVPVYGTSKDKVRVYDYDDQKYIEIPFDRSKVVIGFYLLSYQERVQNSKKRQGSLSFL